MLDPCPDLLAMVVTASIAKPKRGDHRSSILRGASHASSLARTRSGLLVLAFAAAIHCSDWRWHQLHAV